MENNELITFKKSEDIFADAKLIVQESRRRAYKAADTSLVMQNWLLGKRIADQILLGEDRAKYGAGVIKSLAAKLTAEFGKGFTQNNLYYSKQFYEAFPEIFHTACGKSLITQLSWSHFRTLLQVDDPKARAWYMNECVNQSWAVKTLQRNVSTQYYFAEISYGVGKGYAFVARQQHIHTAKKDYFIDLVFYNYILKCFVLIDLKIGTVTHQDVGQMDMYVRMYDELKSLRLISREGSTRGKWLVQNYPIISYDRKGKRQTYK